MKAKRIWLAPLLLSLVWSANAGKTTYKDRMTRTPASLSASELEAKMSDSLGGFISEVNGVTNDKSGINSLHRIIGKYDTVYNTIKDDDLKIIIALAAPMKHFRGLLWKLGPLLGGEIPCISGGTSIAGRCIEIDTSNNKMRGIHGSSVTLARSLYIASGSLILNPTGRAFFHYITQPYVENGKLVDHYDFGNKGVVELQNDLVNELIPSLKKAISRLRDIKLTKTHVFDNRLVFGKNSFKGSTPARFSEYGDNDRKFALANMLLGLSELERVLAFDMTGSHEVLEESLSRLGIIGLGTSNGITAKDARDIIKTSNSWGKVKHGKLLSDSYEHLKEAVRIARELEPAVRSGQSTGLNFLVNVQGLGPMGNFLATQNLDALDAAINSKGGETCEGGGVLIKGNISNETACINYEAFYNGAPADGMRALSATKFKGGDEFKKIKLTYKKDGDKKAKSHDVPYRNFARSAPTDWNLSSNSFYVKIFPAIAKKSSQAQKVAELKKSVRVLSQAWGTIGLAGTVAPFVFDSNY